MWNLGTEKKEKRRIGWKEKWNSKSIPLVSSPYWSTLQCTWRNHEVEIWKWKVKEWSELWKANQWKDEEWSKFWKATQWKNNEIPSKHESVEWEKSL